MPGSLQKKKHITILYLTWDSIASKFLPCAVDTVLPLPINSMMDLKDSRNHSKEESQYRLMTAEQTGKIHQLSGNCKNVTGRIGKKALSLTHTLQVF